MTPILDIDNVSKKFTIQHQRGYKTFRESILDALKGNMNASEEFYALKDISFSVDPGDSIGIIGRNGSGKSTLLKILSRITPPTSGRVTCRGRMASLLGVGTGFHPELTGRENVFFNGSLLGMNRREIIGKFDEIIDFSGTEKFLDTPLKHYSSGMQLRLAFSVAAFLEPEILVIDEVLAVGDAEFQKKCIQKMESVVHGGKTILFVSHNMTAVANLCNKTVLLDRGDLVKEGVTSQVIDHYITGENERLSSAAHEVMVGNGVTIEKLVVNTRQNGSIFQELDFSFKLRSDRSNSISGLALLLHNEMNERVGILDLRNETLSSVSNKSTIEVSGMIRRLPLVEGTYYLGLNIVSNLYQGDNEKLVKFEVHPVQRETIAFDKRYRGFVEFDFDYTLL